MLKIMHRVNTIDTLKNTPEDQGIELDLRDQGERIIIRHDPFGEGELFEDWLEQYRHKTLILNIKADGIEFRLRELMHRRGIENYFFLDSQFPTIMRLIREGETNIAVRFSEHEPAESALALAGKVKWLWVDCFSRLPFEEDSYAALKKHFKMCIVSPELQGHPVETISEYKRLLEKFPVEAVCTDFPELW